MVRSKRHITRKDYTTMKSSVQMSILLCFLAICFPDAVLSISKAKTLHEVINLHRSNDSVSNAYTRIIGGSQASQGVYPWQAALVEQVSKIRNGKNVFIWDVFCGGSLIYASWVLTAAHCVVDANGNVDTNFRVRMGLWKVEPDEERFKKYGQDFTVLKVIVHPSYNSKTDSHDVALVQLDRLALITNYVNTVALPAKTDKKELREGKACVVTGFGYVDAFKTPPTHLQEVHVNIPKTTVCDTLYQNLGYQLDDSMICAGKINGKYDSCQGDSGGPLVCKHTVGTKYYLHGVVSWGIGCGEAKQYGVYANVIYFLDWITQNAV